MAKETFFNRNGEEIVVLAAGYGASAEESKEQAYQNALVVERHDGIEFILDAINNFKPFFRMTYPCKDKNGKLTGRFATKYCENRGIPEEALVSHPTVKATKSRKAKVA